MARRRFIYKGAWRAIFGILLLGAAACRSKTSATAAPQARHGGAPASAAPTPSAGPADPPKAGPAFSIVGTFGPDVYVRAYPLGAGVAVAQQAKTGWSVLAIEAKKPPVDLTAKVGAKRKRPMDVSFVGGSGPDDAWLSAVDDADMPALHFYTWHINNGTITPSPFGRLTAVGELRPGQWVALPSNQGPAYLVDYDSPSRLQVLRGKGAVPKVPAEVRLFRAAFLGEGRACGLGVVVGPKWSSGDPLAVALWAGTPGTSLTVGLGSPNDASSMHVARGPRGECVVIAPEADGTTFSRLIGDELSSTKVGVRAADLSAAPNGAIWLHDGDKVYRARLGKDDEVALAAAALPAGFDGACSLVDYKSLAAVGDDDAWALASCKEGHVLLHTEPEGRPAALPPP